MSIYKCTCCDCDVPGMYPGHCTHCMKGYGEVSQEPIEMEFSKSSVDKHTVFGWANISANADGTIPLDWDGDMIPVDVLESAAYQFVLKYRKTGEMHEGEAVGDLIESVMFTKQKMKAMGLPEGIVPEGWWVGFHVPDEEVCKKIKDGSYNMFSIQGRYKRLKV